MPAIDPVQDRRWMLRALRLASLGLGTTWPNPPVGCVLVRDGRLIGEGRHRIWGQEHAEVAALMDCRSHGNDPAGATAYVTLAPCTRHGRQPPCTNALIAARVARVVVAVEDPNQDAAAAILGGLGIIYQSGVAADLAQHLHGGFLTRITHGRPRFTGKWAMTLDGCLATSTGASGWISSPLALARSRRRRRAFDAILVGSGTVGADDPRLASTAPRTRRLLAADGSFQDQVSPLRIVISASARLSLTARLFQDLPGCPLLLVHGPQADPAHCAALRQRGVLTESVADAHDVMEVAAALGRRGLDDVLVEGGAAVHGAFLRAGLYDRLEVYQGGFGLGGGWPVAREVPGQPGAPRIEDGTRWQVEAPPEVLGSTVLTRWRRADQPL